MDTNNGVLLQQVGKFCYLSDRMQMQNVIQQQKQTDDQPPLMYKRHCLSR